MTSKHFSPTHLASLIAFGAAFGALVACGSAPGGEEPAGSTSQAASGVCENSPFNCTAQLADSSSLSEAGYLFVTCTGLGGNGVYTLGLGTSSFGPWVLATDPSNLSGAIPYVNGSTTIQFNDVAEDNGSFPGGEVLATYVEVCAQSSNICPQSEVDSQCVFAAVTLLPSIGSSSGGSSSGGSSSGSSSGGSSSGSSSGGSSSGSSSGGRKPPPPPPPPHCGKFIC